MIESQRLSFIRNNQTVIRAEVLNGLEEAVGRGETEPATVGMRVILPASFTGGSRYMFNNCQDAMAICKRFGYPDLFITITCNSNWDNPFCLNNPSFLRFVAHKLLLPSRLQFLLRTTSPSDRNYNFAPLNICGLQLSAFFVEFF